MPYQLFPLLNGVSMPNDFPDKEYYSISEVCKITGLKSHVLRYWESQFKILSPSKNRAGNRAYRKNDIQMVQLIKHLLYTEKYTIDGAKRKLKLLKNMGENVGEALPKEEKDRQLIGKIRRELIELKALLS
jgi:DNA-binding transcriptional MerR regulator